eukprot:228652-Pyramimonas_sp.AAC.1
MVIHERQSREKQTNYANSTRLVEQVAAFRDPGMKPWISCLRVRPPCSLGLPLQGARSGAKIRLLAPYPQASQTTTGWDGAGVPEERVTSRSLC